VPSKLISYLLAARPIIVLAVAGSEVARIIERSGAGWVIEPDQPETLAAQIRAVAAIDPAELARRGQSGRDFALQYFTREACLPRVIHILEQAAT
jgi:glycosyltransferase involved in cell wall biosynthesis